MEFGPSSFAFSTLQERSFLHLNIKTLELGQGKNGLIAGLFFGLAFGMGGLGSAALGKVADMDQH